MSLCCSTGVQNTVMCAKVDANLFLVTATVEQARPLLAGIGIEVMALPVLSVCVVRLAPDIHVFKNNQCVHEEEVLTRSARL